MEKVSIYHNPRCSKSRKSIEILDDLGIKYNVIDYIKNPPKKNDLINLLGKLKMEPIDIIRTNEEEYKSSNLANETDRDKLIDFILEYPKVLQRPIISVDKKAVIGRPPENIYRLLNEG